VNLLYSSQALTVPHGYRNLAASSPTPAQEDSARLTLVHFSSVGRSVSQCSWLESGTNSSVEFSL